MARLGGALWGSGWGAADGVTKRYWLLPHPTFPIRGHPLRRPQDALATRSPGEGLTMAPIHSAATAGDLEQVTDLADADPSAVHSMDEVSRP